MYTYVYTYTFFYIFMIAVYIYSARYRAIYALKANIKFVKHIILFTYNSMIYIRNKKTSRLVTDASHPFKDFLLVIRYDGKKSVSYTERTVLLKSLKF